MTKVSGFNQVTNAFQGLSQNNVGQLMGRKATDITKGLGSFCANIGDGLERGFIIVKNAVVSAAKYVWAGMQAGWSSVRTAYASNPKQFLVVGGVFALGVTLGALVAACCNRSTESVTTVAATEVAATSTAVTEAIATTVAVTETTPATSAAV